MRLSSLSKSLAGTHRFTRPPFPFLSLSTWINPPSMHSPLSRERILDDEFPAISIAFDCDCFLNLSPRSVLRDPFPSLLSLIASEFFTIPTPSVENRRMQFLSYGEPFLPPSRVRSSPFFHASHLRFDDTYLSSTLQHARSTRYDNRSFRTLFIRSDLASQNNYRSHRINDIPR